MERKKKMTFPLILVAVCIVSTVVGQVLMKYGMSQIGEITTARQLFDLGLIFKIFTNPFILGGMLCFGSMLIIWLAAMSTLDISFMYPMASLVYVLTAVVALVFLHETISLLRWTGIFLVMGGCFIIGQS